MPEKPKKPKPKLDLNRRDIPKQLPQVRRHNFNEVTLGYPAETAVAEAKRCKDLHCTTFENTDDQFVTALIEN